MADLSTTAGGMVSLLGLDPDAYRPHLLHLPGRTYVETNCYTDILIELLHARGEEPLAVLGFTVRMDFEGDQWTFFKPPPEDLELLFGIDIHEMQPYRPLPQQLAEQISQGRTMIVELDSWYLPDTAATSYRTEHVKTSVAVEAIDREGERLRYFHATGLHELEGEDYRGVFHLGAEVPGDILPPYTEIVQFGRPAGMNEQRLRELARPLLRAHLERRPATNPFNRFAEQLEHDLPRLLEGDSADYHAYAFATARMVGSAFEACSSHAEWLLGEDATDAREAMGRIVDGSKTLSFRLARRRPFDPEPALALMAGAWEEALTRLDDVL